MNKRLLLLFISVSFLFSAKLSATVILQYHHIADDTPKATSTSPALFVQHMDYLAENNFNVISIEQLLDSLAKQKALPPKSVVITFDDGYDSIYKNAFPILKRKQFPFTVFINTQPLEQKLSQFMTWGELIELTEHKGTIANHSVTHPHFVRKLEGESHAQWRERIANEVLLSQQTIDSKLSKTVRAVAYPYGEYNFEIKKLIRTMGFYGFGQQSGAVSLDVDKQAIPRFPFGGSYGEMSDFKLKVNSLAMPLEKVELYTADGSPLNDHLLTPAIKRPQLKLWLKDKSLSVNCFFGPQGRLDSRSEKGGLVFYPKVDLTAGRSRYNCTAASGVANQFYWFSQPWIKPKDDGSWYKE